MSGATSVMAAQAMNRAAVILLRNYPFFGTLYMNLKKVEDESVDTMATDGVHIFYNPTYVLDVVKFYGDCSVAAVLAHEALHCAFRHMTRRRERDPDIWNLACDAVINPIVLQTQRLPGEPFLFNGAENMSEERVYDMLAASSHFNKNARKVIENSAGGAVMDAPCKTQREAAALDRKWEEAVEEAAMVMDGMLLGGPSAEAVVRLSRAIACPESFSWESALRRFVGGATRFDFSWSRPNRRHLHGGLYLPSSVPDGVGKLMVMIDTSGSIGNDQLNRFRSEVQSIMDEGGAGGVTVVYADTQVRGVDTYEPNEQVTFQSCKGGGGTAFDQPMAWAAENSEDHKAVIFLTDMMTFSYGKDPGLPTLWVAVGGYSYKAPPFGEVIAMR